MESQSSTATVYRWFADSPGNAPADGSSRISVGTGLITFDSEGNVVASGTVPKISIDRTDINAISPLEFELDFSKLSGLAASKSTLSASRQDGSSATMYCRALSSVKMA